MQNQEGQDPSDAVEESEQQKGTWEHLRGKGQPISRNTFYTLTGGFFGVGGLIGYATTMWVAKRYSPDPVVVAPNARFFAVKAFAAATVLCLGTGVAVGCGVRAMGITSVDDFAKRMEVIVPGAVRRAGFEPIDAPNMKEEELANGDNATAEYLLSLMKDFGIMPREMTEGEEGSSRQHESDEEEGATERRRFRRPSDSSGRDDAPLDSPSRLSKENETV
jgi:hypothetical protein